ncbi:MAG: hypothetical protein B7X81_01370 [Hydrogenophilales bacterium 17-61-76]|nr:MAG: hypothetical protein B7X81_01370 [Hydrogenophilales bacterium 17-61-76]
MKPFALARVLQLATGRSETQARTVKLAHGIWLDQRVKALRLLEQRHLAQIAVQQRRIEQRQHDELVELAHHRESRHLS